MALLIFDNKTKCVLQRGVVKKTIQFPIHIKNTPKV